MSPQERMARAMYEHDADGDCWSCATQSGREWWLKYADTALALARELVREAVPEQFNIPTNYCRYDHGQVRGHNAARAAVLKALGNA